eukprot:468922_1
MTIQRIQVFLFFTFLLTKSYQYDFIVIGSGTGGIVASRLAESKYSVLLIEAGPDDLTFNCTSCGTSLANQSYPSGWPLIYDNPTIDPLTWIDANTPNDIGQFWNYNQTELLGGYNMTLRRYKILGGCSTHNSGVWTRGDYRNFDYVAQVLGCKGWAFKDVLPYFNKIETYTGDGEGGANGPVEVVQKSLDGDINIIFRVLFDLAVKAGYPANPFKEHQDFSIHHGVMPYPRALRYWQDYPDQRGRNFNAFEMRQSTSQAYIRRIGIPSRYLTVLTDTMVQRVLFDVETYETETLPKAIGVEYWDENGHLAHVFCNKEVIVSGGYVLSPQLLMLSGIGPEHELIKHNIPIVRTSDKIGRYGQDNLLISMQYEANETLQTVRDLAIPNIVLPYNTSNRSAGVNIINASNVYETNITGLYNTVRYQCFEAITCNIETNLRSKNLTINLRGNDSRIYPNVYRYYFSDKSDWDRIIRDIREFRRIMSFDEDGSFVREVRPGLNFSTDEQLREYVIDNSYWAIHEVGTLSMGPNDNDAVDLECSVNGVNNLRVVDASIWPAVRVAGSMSLTYMIGEKCSQHILDRYDSQSKSKWEIEEYIILFSIILAIIIIFALIYCCYKKTKSKSYRDVKAETPLIERNRI